MTTFSQLVDAIVSETKRPDLVTEIARYLNQTIREMHFTTDRNAAIFFRDNYKEELVNVGSVESGFGWPIPDPSTFQGMAAVKYPDSFDRDGAIWPEEVTPGRHLNGRTNYFYRVGGAYVFAGYSGVNASIALGWYEFPPSLKYRLPAARPAEYDVESGWTYADGVNTDELKAGARAVTSNWILLRWAEVVAEGVRAKVYKRLADTERARTCYSLYGSLRQGFFTSETAELGG